LENHIFFVSNSWDSFHAAIEKYAVDRQEQGDQIFAHWVIFYFGYFIKITDVALYIG
jgi:hypothetical protein